MSGGIIVLISYEQMVQFFLPIASIVGGFLAGIVFEKIIISRFKQLSRVTNWEGDDILIGSVKGTVLLLFVIAGVYGSVLSSPVSPTVFIHIQKILLVLAIVVGTVVFSRLAGGFASLYSNKFQGVLPSTSIFVNLTRLVVFVTGVLIMLQSLGISITPILTALGVGGLAVALALQDTLSNLFSGLHLIMSGQLKPGDYIKLDTGDEGYVVDITWRNTTIRPFSNNLIVIPNAKIATAVITNCNRPEEEVAVYVPVGVSYDSDLNKVETVTIQVAKEVMNEVEGGVAEYQPIVRYNEFADSSINFTVIMRARGFGDQYIVKHEFIKKLHERFGKEGIEIPFPIRTVCLKG